MSCPARQDSVPERRLPQTLKKCSVAVTKPRNNGGAGKRLPREGPARRNRSYTSRGWCVRVSPPRSLPSLPGGAAARPGRPRALKAPLTPPRSTVRVPLLGYASIVGPATPAAATMPMFAIYTNVCKDAVPDSLLGDLTQQLAKATGKPAQVRAGGGAVPGAESTCAAGARREGRPRGISAPSAPGAGGPREQLRRRWRPRCSGGRSPFHPAAPHLPSCLEQQPGLQERGAHVAGDVLRLCRRSRLERRSCAVARTQPGTGSHRPGAPGGSPRLSHTTRPLLGWTAAAPGAGAQ